MTSLCSRSRAPSPGETTSATWLCPARTPRVVPPWSLPDMETQWVIYTTCCVNNILKFKAWLHFYIDFLNLDIFLTISKIKRIKIKTEYQDSRSRFVHSRLSMESLKKIVTYNICLNFKEILFSEPSIIVWIRVQVVWVIRFCFFLRMLFVHLYHLPVCWYHQNFSTVRYFYIKSVSSTGIFRLIVMNFKTNNKLLTNIL